MQKTEHKNTNKKYTMPEIWFCSAPLPCLRDGWCDHLMCCMTIMSYLLPTCMGEGDSNLPCQAGFKLPSPSPLSIHLLRVAKQLPNTQRTVETHAKLLLCNLYWSLFMSYVLKILLLIRNYFDIFWKKKQFLFLFNLYTLGLRRMQPIQTLKLSISGCVCVYLLMNSSAPHAEEGEYESARVELLPLCTHLSKYDSTVTSCSLKWDVQRRPFLYSSSKLFVYRTLRWCSIRWDGLKWFENHCERKTGAVLSQPSRGGGRVWKYANHWEISQPHITTLYTNTERENTATF